MGFMTFNSWSEGLTFGYEVRGAYYLSFMALSVVLLFQFFCYFFYFAYHENLAIIV